MAKNLLFLGPPGSGKGTQAARLAQKQCFVQLSSGDALRHEREAGSEIGRKAARYMDAGDLVPDDVITGVMLAALDTKVPRDCGLILDGFPRTVEQAKALDCGLAERHLKIHAVVDFELPDDEVVARISSRRVCTKCGSTYNTEFLPPRREGACDRCGAALTQRSDDHAEVVRNRLEKYRQQTAPLIAYYAQRGLLTQIDAAGDVGVIADRVSEIVNAAP